MRYSDIGRDTTNGVGARRPGIGKFNDSLVCGCRFRARDLRASYQPKTADEPACSFISLPPEVGLCTSPEDWHTFNVSRKDPVICVEAGSDGETNVRGEGAVVHPRDTLHDGLKPL
jgi:hypothetical protein